MFIRPVERINIEMLVFMPSNAYQNVPIRPFNAHVTPGVVNAIGEVVERSKGGQITTTAVAGIASSVITPSTAIERDALITHGWQMPRGRFMMRVRVTYRNQDPVILLMQGYTDHQGYTDTGAVDPNMRLTINSYVVIRYVEHLINGVPTVLEQVGETNQILHGHFDGDYSGQMHGVRPEDIFGTLQLNEVYPDVPVIGDSRSLVRQDYALKNERLVNTSVGHLATTLDGFVAGYNNTAPRAGGGVASSWNGPMELVSMPSLAQNPFISAISDVYGLTSTNNFTVNDLWRLDPNTDNVTKISRPSQRDVYHMEMYSAGNVSDLHNNSRETIIATSLAHQIPALLLQYYLGAVSLVSTNMQSREPITTIANTETFTSADMSQYIAQFVRRFEREILFDVTFGFEEMFFIEIDSNVFGDTIIKVGINGRPVIPFCFPTFTDGLYSPNLTTDPNRLSMMAGSIQDLLLEVNPISARVNTQVMPGGIYG